MGNFNDQWVEIFAAGTHTDKEGGTDTYDKSFIENVVQNFNPSIHEPPITIGHPENNAPAYGWVRRLRTSGDKLEAQFSDVDPQFESLVKEGRFKKRSASFYVGGSDRTPALRHVGFLGATPPVVKGLRPIQFSEGESLTFEFSEETMAEKKDAPETVNTIGDRVLEYLKSKLGKGGDPAPAPANFSEADVKRVVGDAVKTVTASFTEEIKKRDTQIADMTKRLDQQSASTSRAEIVAFCEKLGPEKFPPAFRKLGVVEFMEQLAGMSDRKVTVIEFEEKEGKKVEHRTESAPLQWFKNFLESLGPFISFGEMLGGLQATGTEGGGGVPPARLSELRAKAGLTPIEGGKK